MKKETLYEIKAIYRDDFRVTGYTFGEGEKALCIIGSMRGNENQQLFCCSRLVARLKRLEEENALVPGKQILVIPCANPYSINTKKRFWCTDNTDINRMFPGYALGETTQRIAAGIFEAVKGMLPKGPLGRRMYKKLFVYAGPEHPHAAQKPEELKL